MKRSIALLFLCVLLCASLSAGADVTASTPLTDRSSAMLNNIDLAIRRVNGTYVARGEEFSFNDEVGPRGTAEGYEKAENGRGAWVIAGGVSQVATTIYLAVKELGGIELTEKQVYGRDFVQSYVSSGDDAIATAWSNRMDFRFINHNAGFTISVWRDSERMYCQLDTQDAPCPRPDPYLPIYGTYYVANCESYISLRAYPDTCASRIARIPYRAAVTCLGWAGNGFYQVEYDGLTGYALSDYLSSRRPPERLYGAGTQLYVYNCERDISLRAYDSTGAPRLAVIPYGDTVTYLDGAYDGFGKVSYRGITGYALTKYLTTRRPYIVQEDFGDWTGGRQPVQPDDAPENVEPQPLQDADWRECYRAYIDETYDETIPWSWVKLIDFTFDGVPEMVLSNEHSHVGNAVIVFSGSRAQSSEISGTTDCGADTLFSLHRNEATGELVWLYHQEHAGCGSVIERIDRFAFEQNTLSALEVFSKMYAIDDPSVIPTTFQYMGSDVSEAEYNRQYTAYFADLRPLDFCDLTANIDWRSKSEALAVFEDLCDRWTSETPDNVEPQPLQDADWRDTYRRVVDARRALEDSDETRYFLHDLNQDGVPELFVGDTSYGIYTIDHGAATQIGYFLSQNAIYADVAEGFLYVETHGGTGLRGFEKFGMDGLSLTVETIVDGYEGGSQARYTKGDAQEPITREEFEAICAQIENTYQSVQWIPASEFQ